MYRAVRCAVSVTAIAAVFGLTRFLDAAAQTPAPKVAAQLNITAPGTLGAGVGERNART